MNKTAALLPLLVVLSLAAGTPAHAGGTAAMAATVVPDLVFPVSAPCSTGTGVHDFTVSGSGLRAGERFGVTVGGVDYPAASADATGAYSVTYEIRSLPAATYAVDVKGDLGSKAVGKISLGYSACRSTSDGRLRLTGGGFGATDPIGVYLDGDATAAVTTTSVAAGEFDVRGECPAGAHTLRVADAHKHELAFTQFTC